MAARLTMRTLTSPGAPPRLQITAAVALKPGADFTLESAQLDEPRADEILVRIAAVGVCHTDLVAREGLMPFTMPAVLGHEGAGTVESVGSAVTKVAPGDRVALTFRSCGACERCRSGDPAYCFTMPALNYIGMRPDGSRGDPPGGRSRLIQLLWPVVFRHLRRGL